MHEFRFRFVFNVSFGLVNPDFSRIPPIFLFKNPINLPFSWQKIPIFPFFFLPSCQWAPCCYLTTSVAAIHFFYGAVIISRQYGSNKRCISRATYFISQHLLQPSVTTSALWLVQENLEGVVFVWGKQL